jgi:two-component system LytT family sensor kinase
MLLVSLARGSKQMITLREEMEFIEMYLTLQDIRSSGRVRQEIDIEPRLHDALVPAMLLQPIVENAYVHGLSKIEGDGLIEITTKADAKKIQIFVRNSGVGLDAAERKEKLGAGIGLNNVRSRLKLHFGDEARLEIRELANHVVEVSLTFPLSFAVPSELASLPGEDSKVLYEPQQEAEPEPLSRAEAS